MSPWEKRLAYPLVGALERLGFSLELAAKIGVTAVYWFLNLFWTFLVLCLLFGLIRLAGLLETAL